MTCCPEHKVSKDKEKKSDVEEMPKTFLGRWLYKIGKAETSKGKVKKEGRH